MGKYSEVNKLDVMPFNDVIGNNNFAVQDNFNYDIFVLKIKNKEKKSELPIILKSLGVLYNIDTESDRILAQTSSPIINNNIDNSLFLILELKHRYQDLFKISPNQLEEKIIFGEGHSIPLRFAVLLNGYWGLFTPEFIESNKYQLAPKDFIGEESKSCFDRELSTCSYMFEGEVKIKSLYVNSQDTTSILNQAALGDLLLYEFYYDNELIFVIDKYDSDFYAYQYVLKGLQETIGRVSTSIKHGNGVTTIIESSKGAEYVLIPEYKLMLPCLDHMLNEKSKHSFQKNIEHEKNPHVCVKVVREVLSHIASLGVNIIVFNDFYGYTFSNYKKKFWNYT